MARNFYCVTVNYINQLAKGLIDLTTTYEEVLQMTADKRLVPAHIVGQLNTLIEFAPLSWGESDLDARGKTILVSGELARMSLALKGQIASAMVADQLSTHATVRRLQLQHFQGVLQVLLDAMNVVTAQEYFEASPESAEQAAE